MGEDPRPRRDHHRGERLRRREAAVPARADNTEAKTPAHRDIVVIGGSAGAISALRELLAALPADFDAAIFVVIHLSPDSPGLLAQALARASTLPVVAAKDGMSVRSGRVVVAVPDFHLVLSDGTVRVARGAKENRHRPSIDVLFRSAAANFGPRATGIVLSGMLDDGAAGLWSIKRQGGIAIVQDPSEADYPAMPQNAMDTTDVDFSLPAAQIGKKLAELAGKTVNNGDEDAPQAMLDEVRMATDSNIDKLDQLGERTPFTCPECGGVLWEISDTGKPRFRCHVGHAFSMATFEAEQGVRVEAALWAALRVLEENERLARRLSDAAAERGNKHSQTYHAETAKSSAQHANALREMLENELPSESVPEERKSKRTKRN